METGEKKIEEKREVVKNKFRWVLGSGRQFEIESSGPSGPDWVRVEIPAGYEVSVLGSKIRRLEGGDKRGEGMIVEIKPGSCFFGKTFVGVGAPARIPFLKK